MNVDKNLNDALDIDSTTDIVKIDSNDISVVDSDKNQITNTISSKEDVKEDYDLGRSCLHQLISAGQEALEGALDVAKNTDSPRAYEVVATTFKNLAEATDKLLDMQKKARDMDGITHKKDGVDNQNATTINNTFFSGTSQELHELLDGKKRGEE